MSKKREGVAVEAAIYDTKPLEYFLVSQCRGIGGALGATSGVLYSLDDKSNVAQAKAAFGLPRKDWRDFRPERGTTFHEALAQGGRSALWTGKQLGAILPPVLMELYRPLSAFCTTFPANGRTVGFFLFYDLDEKQVREGGESIAEERVRGVSPALVSMLSFWRLRSQYLRMARIRDMLQEIHLETTEQGINRRAGEDILALGYRSCWIGMLADKPNRLEKVACDGCDSNCPKSLPFKGDRDGTPEAKAVESGASVVHENIREGKAPAGLKQDALRRGYNSLLVIPLRGEGKVEGVMNIYSDAQFTFDKNEVELLELFASQYSGAVKRASMREELALAEKMNLAGKLFAGLAHDLNNPLSGVTGFAQLLMMDERLPTWAKGDLEKIHHEADRAGKIMREMLDFAGRRPPDKKLQDLNAFLRSLLAELEEKHKEQGIKVRFRPGAALGAVPMDKDQVDRIFRNIIGNAAKALVGKKRGKLLQVVVSRDSLRGVKTVCISFTNNGPAIAKDKLEKVFEPFFSAQGGGFGLGLFISRDIAQRHGGEIEVFSLPRGGARFCVHLPLKGG